jgi:hypothetical protein
MNVETPPDGASARTSPPSHRSSSGGRGEGRNGSEPDPGTLQPDGRLTGSGSTGFEQEVESGHDENASRRQYL